MIVRRPFILLTLLVFAPALGVPQEGGSAPSSIAGAAITLVVGAPEGGNETVRRIVASSIELALIRRGVLVVAGTPEEASDLRSERGLADARAAGSDFLLQASVTPVGDQIEIVLSLYETVEGDLLARLQAVEPVALTLDRALSTLTDRLLAQSAGSVEAAAAERRAGIAEREAERVEQERAAEAEQAAADERAASRGRAPTDGSAGAGNAGVPGGAPEPVVAPPNRVLAVSAGFAPLVPIDRSAAYLALGYGGTLVLSVMPFADDFFGFGLMVRTAAATVTGAAASVDLLLLPIGLVVSLAQPARPLGAYLRVAAGASFLRATSAVLGSFPDVIPYASADAGVRLGFGIPVSLELGVGVEAYFEGSIVILGVTPGIALVVEL